MPGHQRQGQGPGHILIIPQIRYNERSIRKTTMARNKILRVRLSDEEWERLESYANSKDYTLTEVIRDYIKRLPKKDTLRSD